MGGVCGGTAVMQILHVPGRSVPSGALPLPKVQALRRPRRPCQKNMDGGSAGSRSGEGVSQVCRQAHPLPPQIIFRHDKEKATTHKRRTIR